jgi:hypothetical protein
MNGLIDVFSLFTGTINRLDRRGVVSGISLIVAVVVCIVLTLRDHISLWQLAPGAVLALLMVGAFLLIRWRVSTTAELSQPQVQPAGLIEIREPEPVALSSRANTGASAKPQADVSLLPQLVIAGIIGGFIVTLSVNFFFVYSDYACGRGKIPGRPLDAGGPIL